MRAPSVPPGTLAPSSRAMVAATLVALLPLGVVAASAAGTPLARDAARAEVHRLINGERVAAGLRPLTVDRLLAGRAHDASFACPGGGSTPGRAPRHRARERPVT